MDLLKQKSEKFILIKSLEFFRNFFCEKLKNKEIKLISKQNQKILEVPIEIFCEKELINFNLEKIKLEKEDLLEQLCMEINKLNEKYEKINEENNKLKSELEEMKNKYDILNNELMFKKKISNF